jgi:hypothetical protein
MLCVDSIVVVAASTSAITTAIRMLRRKLPIRKPSNGESLNAPHVAACSPHKPPTEAAYATLTALPDSCTRAPDARSSPRDARSR